MKLKISINNRWTGKVIFEFETENNTVAKTINEYVRQTKEQNGMYARANLTHANLTHANLTDADLTHANLTDADLTHANLTRANLTHANLTHANLTDANLTDADLTHANLTDANLTRANLRSIKADFFLILLSAKNEVSGLKQALIDGKIDGSTYTGSCACLVGTIANVRGCGAYDMLDIPTDSNRPAERWFLGINPGVTPENNTRAKITLEWIEEFEMLTAKTA